MGLLTSPIDFGGIALAILVALNLYSSSVRDKRFTALGTGLPPVVRSRSFGKAERSASGCPWLVSRKSLDIVIAMFKAVKKHKFYYWTKEMLEEYDHTI